MQAELRHRRQQALTMQASLQGAERRCMEGYAAVTDVTTYGRAEAVEACQMVPPPVSEVSLSWP